MTDKAPRSNFLKVMDFMNNGIENDLFPYMPRRTLVTEDEIDSLWIPSIPKNTTYHLFSGDYRLVGSATIFGDVLSNSYEHNSSREPSALGLVIDPTFDSVQRATRLVLEKIISSNTPFYDIIPIEDKETIRTYRHFNMTESFTQKDAFKDIGLSGDCIRFDYYV